MDQTTRTELINRIAERRKEKAAAETKKQTDRAALVEALKKKRAETPPDPSKIYVSEQERQNKEKERLYTSVIPDEYKQYTEAADYALNSKQASSFKDKLLENKDKGGYISKNDNGRYKRINENKGNLLNTTLFSNVGRYDYINEDEKALFNYLFNTGKVEEAYNYLDSIEDTLQERQLYEDNERYRDRSDFANFNTARGQKILSGVEGISNLVGGVASLVTGEKLKVNDYHTKKAQLMDAAVTEDMSPVGAEIYSIGTSIADCFVSMVTGGTASKAIGATGKAATAVSGILTHLQNSGQATSAMMSEVKDRGLEDWQILALGVTAGAIEVITEQIPMNRVFKAVNSKQIIKGGAKLFTVELLKQMGIEAVEEMTSETVNIIADGIIAAEKSNFSTLCQSYMDEGMSRPVAIGKAVLNSAGQVLRAGIGGAVSGGFFGAGAQTVGSIRNNAYYRKQGRAVNEVYNSAEQLLAVGEASSDTTILNIAKEAREAYEANPTSKKARDRLGRLAAAVEEDYQSIKEKETRSLDEKVDKSERESLTAELETWGKSEYAKLLTEYRAQNDKARAIALAAEREVEAARNNAESMPARLKYDAATTRAYENGLAAFKNNGGDRLVFDLGFEQARRLGRSAEGRTLGVMLRTLDERTQREILALPTDAINAAFNAGVARAEYYKSRQAEIDRKAKEKAAATATAETSEKKAESKAERKAAKKASKNKKALVIDQSVESAINTGKLTRAQKKDIAKLRLLAESLDSVTIRIADLRGEGRNGKYNLETNELVVSIYAGRETALSPFDYALSQAFSHESVHYIRENAPADYARLEAFVEDTFFKGLTLDYLVDMRRRQYIDRFALDIVREEREGLSDEDLQELDELDRELTEKYNDLERKSILLQLVDKEQNSEQYEKLVEERKKTTEETSALEVKLQEKLASLGCQRSFFRAREEVSFTYEEAKEEVIANALEDIWDKPQVLNALVNEDINLVKRIWRAIKQFFEKLFNKLEKYNYTNPEARIVAEATKAEWKRLSDIYLTALKNANNPTKASDTSAASASTTTAAQSESTSTKSESKVKSSLSGTPTTSINKENMQVRLPEDFYEKLEVAISDDVKSDDRRYLDFGEIPSFYTETLSNKISIRKLPLVMNYRDVYLAANSKENGKFQGKDINYHNLGKAAIAQIKEAINDPLYVVRSEKKGKRGETRIQIITKMLDYKENSIMVFVELDTHAQNNERYINAHVINSAYGRKNIQKAIETAREQSNLLYEKRLAAREGIDTISSAFNNEPSNNSIPENEKKVNTSEKKVKNSFAGTLAATADRMKLSNAERLLAEGYDSETVRKETGWFKGYDGKWRFEIDDSEAEVAFNGKFSRDPDIRRYAELVDKVYFSDTATQEEQNELSTLDKKIGDRNITPDKLGDLLNHPALFEAYPKLADIDVYFAEGTDTTSYHPGFKEIAMPKSLKMNSKKFKETLLHEVQHAVQDIEGFAGGSNVEMFKNSEGQSAFSQYKNTAGEIEARDVSARNNLTAEQRKNTRPDIDRTDVVFAGGNNVSYLSKEVYDPETSRIKEQLENARERLNQMEIVFQGKVPLRFDSKTFAKNWANNQLKTYGYKVDKQGFGIIEFAKNDIYGAIEHLTNGAEIAAIVAVPRVMKRGIQIGEHGNHKLREKHTVTFAAPVELNGTRGNMAVVVNMKNHKYYVHRVVLPDGSAFRFLDNKNANREMYQGVPNGSLANTTRLASINSIPQNTENVNGLVKNNSSKSSLTGYASSDERLAEAFAELAMTDVEYSWLMRYKNKAKQIGEWQEEKEKAQAKLKQLEERKKNTEAGGKLDAIYKDIKEQRSIIASREAAINSQREKMLNIENAGPLRELMQYKQKLLANDLRMRYGHTKLYSRKDAAVLFEDALVKNMPKETRNAFIDEIFTGLNKHTKFKARYRFANEMAAKLVDTVWTAPEYLKDTEGFRERLDILSPGARRLEFTEAERKELRDKLGLKKSTSLMLEWEYNKVGEAVNAKEFILNSAKTLEENGTLAKVDDRNYIDTFLELNELYKNAKRFVDVEQDIKKEDDSSWQEKQKIAKEFAQEILGLYQNTGTKTKFGKTVDNYKRQIEDMRDQTKLLSLLEWRAIKMRELKYGAFVNATKTFDNVTLQQVISDLASVQYRGRINVDDGKRLKKALADLALWYTEDNKMINDKDNKDNPQANYYVQDIADKIKYLKDLDSFSNSDLKILTNVFDHLMKIVETYNKVFINGKWQDAKEMATGYLEKINKNIEYGIQPLSAVFSFGKAFFDPRSLCRGVDGYDPDGFCTTILDMLADAAIKAQVEERNLLAEYNEFCKTKGTKKYVADARKNLVEYRGKLIPRINLVQLYMTTKRRQAAAGLVYNGFKVEYKKKGKFEVVTVNGLVKREYDTENNAVSFLLNNSDGQTRYDEYLPDEVINALVEKMRSDIEGLLTEQDKAYIKILEEVYNHSAKELKRKRDIDRMGYSNVIEGYYVPIRRDGIAHSIDSANYFDELNDRVSNASFNKNTVKGAKQKLFICDADTVFRGHTKKIALYAHLHPVIEVYDRLNTVDCAEHENANDPETIKAALDRQWKGGREYIGDIIADMQGIRASQARDGALQVINNMLGKVTSSYAIGTLGLNPKVWLTQISSVFASVNILDPGSLIKAFSKEISSFEDVDKYCEYAMLRHTDNSAAKAQGLFDSVHRWLEWTMAPIGIMDRAVVTHLFGACQYQVEKDGGAAVGTEENKVAAGELLKRVILETQQNAIMTERSAAMRSQNTIMRFFTMFKSDAMKVVGRVIDAGGEIRALKKRIAHCSDATERAALKAQYRVAWTKLARSTSALVLTSAYMTALAFIWRAMRGKLSDDKKERWHEVGVDFIGNLIGGLPFITDLYTKFLEGYDSEYVALSSINDMVGSVSSLLDGLRDGIFDDEWKNIGKKIKNFAISVGLLFGVPVRNIYNIIRTIVRMFVPDWVDNVADKYV